MSDNKRLFWVVYDYDQGGLWALVSARSAEEITAKYPVLKIESAEPAGLSDEQRQHAMASNYFDIDAAPPQWLARAMDEQK